MARPYFETNTYALVPLMDNGDVNQQTIYIYDGEEDKAEKKYQISSQITSVYFIKGCVMFTGYDEVRGTLKIDIYS